jgi:hypothetical protein
MSTMETARPRCALALLAISVLCFFPLLYRQRLDSMPLPPRPLDLEAPAAQHFDFEIDSSERYVAWLRITGLPEDDPWLDAWYEWAARDADDGRDPRPIEVHLAAANEGEGKRLRPSRPHVFRTDPEERSHLLQLGRWNELAPGPYSLRIRLVPAFSGLTSEVAAEVIVDLDTYSWLHTQPGLLAAFGALGGSLSFALCLLAFAWFYGSRWRRRRADRADPVDPTPP